MQMGIIAPVPKVKDPNDLEAARSEATAKSHLECRGCVLYTDILLCCVHHTQ